MDRNIYFVLLLFQAFEIYWDLFYEQVMGDYQVKVGCPQDVHLNQDTFERERGCY